MLEDMNTINQLIEIDNERKHSPPTKNKGILHKTQQYTYTQLKEQKQLQR